MLESACSWRLGSGIAMAIVAAALASACAPTTSAVRRNDAVEARSCPVAFNITQWSRDRIAITLDCEETKHFSLPCEAVRVSESPSAPFAAVFCYEKVKPEDLPSDLGSTTAVADCRLAIHLFDLRRGRHRAVDPPLDPLGGECADPAPVLAQLGDVWSPKGKALAILAGPKGPFHVFRAESIGRWIEGDASVHDSVSAPTAAEEYEERTGEGYSPDDAAILYTPEAHTEPFHGFEGWHSDTVFAFTGSCCGTADFYTYDVAAMKRRHWGTCDGGEPNLGRCIREKRGALGLP